MVLATGFAGISIAPTAVLGTAVPYFTFAAAGNIGSNVNSAATLTRLASSNASFFLALGDLSLNGTGSEPGWCNFVKSRVGSTYPFELLSGDQEDNGPNGLIDNYTACLPDRVGIANGTYGKEYYFDYPATNPLARFIEISPSLTFTNGGSYGYSVANTHYRWVATAIDGARSAGIPWVIVSMHKFCLSVSSGSCDVGQDLIDLLTAKRVDLVLEGHGVDYQRSKQLSCAIRTFYVPECVANDGSTGTYPKGAGTVFVNAGTGGVPQQSVSTSDSEYKYFVPSGLMGSNTAGTGFGFVSYTVTASQINVTTSFSKKYADRFSIASQPPAPAPAPTIPAPRAPFTFTASGDIGSTASAVAALARIPSANANFTLALGDLSYNGTGSEPAWCSLVASKVGASYPYELLAGNHEDNGPDGLIDNFVKCLPDRIGGLNGTYGKEYSFDYPATNPLARIILISPAMSFTFGGTYSYSVANSHYTWLVKRIDDARAKGIPWVIVGMHEYCIIVGGTCGVGQDLQDILSAKRVDLVLGGHFHAYERSKDLACGVRSFYVPQCVVADGSTGFYPKGAGTVFNIVGTGGGSLNSISKSDVSYPYFVPAALMGSNTPGNGWGSLVFTVRADRIDAVTSLSGTFSDRFTIATPLAADFRMSPASADVGLAVGFTAVAAGGKTPYTALWDFGDGTKAGGLSVSHVFLAAGTYSVTLQLYDALGTLVTVRHAIAVNPALAASFSYVPPTPAAGDIVAFSASTTGGTAPFAYAWLFGDGGSASGATPSHTFATSGAYTVNLTVTDSVGQSSMASSVVGITPGLAASFNFTPSSPSAGDNVTFNATASGGTGPYTYSWNLGDGNVSSGPTVTHAYAVPSTFTVTLVVSDSAGHSATLLRGVGIAPALNATFTVAPSSASAGDNVTFTANASGGTGPYTYAWNLGDGNVSNTSTAIHAYAAGGTFTVTLIVSDSGGHAAASQQTIVIAPALNASFTVDPAFVLAGANVTFNATATGGFGPYNFSWSFGDGNGSYGASVVHAFAIAGTYVVTLTVSDQQGHLVSVIANVVVN